MNCWLFQKTKIKEKSKEIVEIEEVDKVKVKDLRIYDDVYIKIDNQLFMAWVVEKTNNRLLLSYEEDRKLKDMQFLIADLDNQSTLTEANRVLILNKEDI